MRPNPTNLLSLIESQHQKIVPIFQRSYSWSERNCRRLWQDLENVSNGTDETHFMGAIVNILDYATTTGLTKVRIIDGQQRVISAALLLLAIGTVANEDKHLEELHLPTLAERHLLLGGRRGDDKYKLILTDHDRATLLALIDQTDQPASPSQRILQNFNYFVRQIKESDLSLGALYNGLRNLTLVEISLTPGEDNPQLIFESLNSTGEALKQSDLIRNFLLMDASAEDQESIYKRHWFPMEVAFGQNGLDTYFDEFMRAYLSLRLGKLVKKDDVYEEFKKFAKSNAAPQPSASLVQEIARFADHFLKIVLHSESTPRLKVALDGLAELGVQKAPRPLLLKLWDEYAWNRLSEDDLIKTIETLQSYIFRRAVCGLRANSLDLHFVEVSKHIASTDQYQTVCADLLAESKSARFPNDEVFLSSLIDRDIYGFQQRNYLLRRIENSWHPLEPLASLSGLTVEHVLPQNDNLSDEWKLELGENWEGTRNKYLHTLGNLTLTGYNSVYSDRPFKEKRDMPNGFASSPLFLNSFIARQQTWSEAQIIERAQELGEIALGIWPLPVVPEVAVRAARQRTVEEPEESPTTTKTFFEDMPPDAVAIYNSLETSVLGFGPDVEREVFATRVTFRAYKIFTQVNKRRGGRGDGPRLLVWVDLDFDELDDPLGICENKEAIGHHGVLDTVINVTTPEHLAFAIECVRLSYDRNSVDANGSDGE